MSKNKPADVNITEAKGRPMLTWVGKRPLTTAKAYPAQAIETVNPELPDGVKTNTADWSDWPGNFKQGGLLFHGDNKDCLAHLLANGFRGKVKLIYIDPPFDSGADYVRKVQLRGNKSKTTIDGIQYSLGEQIQYTDIWANDSYLQFMYERLLMLKELLSEDGSLWLHCDWHKSHLLRTVMDEVFGVENLQNEVIWQRTDPHNDAKSRLGWVHDTILWYCKDRKAALYNWEAVVEPLSNAALKEYSLIRLPDGETVSLDHPDAGSGRRFKLDDCTWKGADPSMKFEWRGATPSDKRVWPEDKEGMERGLKEGRFYLRNPEKGAARCKVSFLDERAGQVLQTIWTECGRMKGGVEYPTQKPPALLARIIQAASNPNDLVLDCFIGSGTTAAVAQKLGRRWIGCDINQGAIQTTAKRLAGIIHEQIAAQADAKQASLTDDDDAPPLPAQLGFGTWRVNDYDLQIQHNEAVALVCDYLGVTRKPSELFFDGELKGTLVKIVPFHHPASPLDVADIQRELKARPEDARDVTLVALGCEAEAQRAIAAHNKHKPANRIELIELRSDAKHGGVLTHEAASAEVDIRRDGDELVVEIKEFLSPTILKRLNMEEGLFRAEITDHRAQIDCVLIDTHFTEPPFNVVLADVPAKKTDLVEGSYRLPAPDGPTTVAVKLLDMLGEEVLVTAEV